MPRTQTFICLGLLLWSSCAFAGPGAELLKCVHMDQTTCPALKNALAAPGNAAAEVGQALTAPGTSSQKVATAGVALGLLLGSKAGPVLYKAAQAHPKGGLTRVELMAAAARNGIKDAAPELMSVVSGKAKMRAAILSMGGLAALNHKPASKPIRRLLAKSSGRVQAAAAHALQSLGGQADVDALLALAAGGFDTFVPARTMALETLTKLAPKRAVSVAVRLIDHPSRAVGRAALKVIAAAPLRWSQPVVKFALQTPGLRGNAALAAVAHKALGREVLVAALASDLTKDERSWLLHALSQLKPLGASEALVGRFDKLAAPAKIEILKALPLLKDQTVVPTLVRTLERTKAPVANYVVYALENVTGERLGDNIDAWRSYAGFDKEPSPAPVEGP